MSWREQPRDRLGRWTEFSKLDYIYDSESPHIYLDGGNNKDKPTPITDRAIFAVPFVHPEGYSLEEAYLIREQHRELLKYARDHNNEREVAFVFREGLRDRSIIHGDATSVNLTYALDGKGYNIFVMHNHPANKSFSTNDIITFIHLSEIKSISIVKHTGAIEVISKTKKYDKSAFDIEFKRNFKKYCKNNSLQSMDKAIMQTLLKNGGMVEWKKLC